MKMKELVVISGKGGTGKTSVTASLAALAGRPVIADCDVDAADLHLVLSPDIRERKDFYSGREAIIRESACSGCGDCRRYCRFNAVQGAVTPSGRKKFFIDPIACEGCGVCVRFCPERAIDFQEARRGEWMVSDTRYGAMVHARLGTAAENSGHLVFTVRKEARRIAGETGASLIIVDGPPGIGCPVIASLTGASMILVVTEPTVSGEHDLERVLALARHFHIPAAVCVNKWDLNPEMAECIEEKAGRSGVLAVGRIRYDPAVTRAQILGTPVVEMGGPVAEDIREVWKRLAMGEE